MKIAGKALTTRNTRVLELVRGGEKIDLVIAALPPGYEARLSALGMYADSPKVPKKAREPKPGVYEKDANGRVIYDEDRDNPEYRAAVTKFNARVRALRLAEHLMLDDKVSFEAKRPTTQTLAAWQAYADELSLEITNPESGFTDAEVSDILDLGDKLESSIDLDEALKRFLPQESEAAAKAEAS